MISILLSPVDAASDLANRLKHLGVRLFVWPELRIDDPENYSALDEAIENLFGYDWLILKNERAASYFLRRFEINHEAAELDDLKILASGDDTTQALAQSQVHVDVLVDRSHAVIPELRSYAGELNGLNVLVPSGSAGREAFEQELEEAGARVDNVAAYRTTRSRQQLAQLSALIVGGGIDAILFTGPQVPAEFARLIDTDDLRRFLGGTATACIDAQTATAAAASGLGEQIVWLDPDAGSLGDVMNTTFAERS